MIGKPNASLTWQSINFEVVRSKVRQLQMRIAKAIREGKPRKAKSLQWLLTHSFYAKLLAVKRVTENRGAKTPGIDKVIWKTPKQKMQAVATLKRRGYQTLPLRRIYIPKKDKSKLRPLSIPSMKCRAMQALYLLALEPVAETLIDKNSYGFRPKRSCADAIEQCFKVLARKDAAQFILEGDIKSCFDKISHSWLLNNIPMDKIILNKWLQAGYVDNQELCNFESGVPQGGVISPTLLNLTLRGLEAKIKLVTKPKDKVHFTCYADDFVVTGSTREILEEKVKPLITKFLKERGLELSTEKTIITHINDGFDFLGFNVRKYKTKLLIKPSKKNVITFLRNMRAIIKSKISCKTQYLIQVLNMRIRGWANYYHHVVSKATFSKVDCNIFKAIWNWAKRKHPKKNMTWLKNKYFCRVDNDNWVFNAGLIPYRGRAKLLTLLKAASIPIVRHVKIQSDANPYSPKYKEYFEKRDSKRNKLYRFEEIAGSI